METEQQFLGNEPENPLFTRRGLLERYKPHNLIMLKRRILGDIALNEAFVNEINEVLDGYGVHSLEDEEIMVSDDKSKSSEHWSI